MAWQHQLRRRWSLICVVILPVAMVMPVQALPQLVVLLRRGHNYSPADQQSNYNLSRMGLVHGLQ
jgi:hypothetical protein